MADGVQEVTSKKKGPFEVGHSLIEFVQLGAHGNNVRLHASLFRTMKKWVTRVVWLAMCRVEGYRLELRNLLHRIALRSGTSYQPFFLDLGPVSHQNRSGLPVECTRKRASSRDIECFAASHPSATAIDWGVFLEGWEAGAKWSSENDPCSCMSPNKISRS
jgi:hypothetical protein